MMSSTEPTACDFTQVGVSDVRTLILLLNSPEPAVCAVAVDALTKYADASIKHRTQLLNLNVVRPLIDLTTSKDAAVKKASVACLASVTELNDVHQDMRRRDLMDVLISTLSREDSVEIQDEAAFALANIAKDFANKADIRKAGGIKVLVKLLESPDPDVKKNVALALSMLLDDFSNRTEIRYVNGISPLLDLLASEFQEVLENALNSLIRCAEDYSNRGEIRKLNGIRRLVDLISQDPGDAHQLALQCLCNCLEEAEAANSLADANGIAPLIKLIQVDDNKLKRFASLALAKASKIERTQNIGREAGALQPLINNLASNDAAVVSSAATALAALGKNDANQMELAKLNVTDSLIKLLGHDDAEVKREAVAALSSMFINAKVRNKIRNTDTIVAVIKLIGSDDPQTIVNASECLSNMAEDYSNRAEIIKQNGVQAMLASLEMPDFKAQMSLCLTLARCLQEPDGQMVLAKQTGFKGLLKIVELLGCKDVNVCRNAAYTLSNATQYEQNAVAACNAGALEALIALSKEGLKSSTKFAADAMEKLLNHHLSAKYWLRNHVTPENIITDGFYDIGFAGTKLEAIQSFPTLADLQSRPIDKRREVILVDAAQDTTLAAIIAYLSDALVNKSPRQQIQLISTVVSRLMGGPLDANASTQVSEFGFKFRVSELKLRTGSNVIPIGMINQGTFYHRALLFKVVCDRVGLGPCLLVRGEYHRAWNIVDLKKQTMVARAVAVAKKEAAPVLRQKQSVAGGAGGAGGGAAGTGAGTSGASSSGSGAAVGGTAVAASSMGTAAGSTAGTAATASGMSGSGGLSGTGVVASGSGGSSASAILEGLLGSLAVPDDSHPYTSDEPAVVDLMFEPGRLLAMGSQEAAAYQRMN